MAQEFHADQLCRIMKALQLFGGAWKPAIIFQLWQKSPQRFNELRKSLPSVSHRILTKQLRELERSGIVLRSEITEKPRRVEYEITNLGVSVVPVFMEIEKWQDANLDRIETAEKRYDSRQSQPVNTNRSG